MRNVHVDWVALYKGHWSTTVGFNRTNCSPESPLKTKVLCLHWPLPLYQYLLYLYYGIFVLDLVPTKKELVLLLYHLCPACHLLHVHLDYMWSCVSHVN